MPRRSAIQSRLGKTTWPYSTSYLRRFASRPHQAVPAARIGQGLPPLRRYGLLAGRNKAEAIATARCYPITSDFLGSWAMAAIAIWPSSLERYQQPVA